LWGPYSRTMAPWSALTIVLFTLHHTPPTQTLSLRPQRCPSECSCQPDTNPAHAPGLMVNCSGRELLQIPEDVPAEATTLLLSGNQLARVPDDVFSHLQELRELDLSANVIASLQRNAFRGLGNLKELNLFRNKLVFGPRAYPDDVFLPLASLTSLRLSSNVWRSWDSESLRPANTKSSQPQTSPVKADGNLLFVSSDIQSHLVDHGLAEASEGFRDSPVTRFSRTTRVSVGNSPVSSRYGGVGYPDRALSQLHNLRYLSLDGLANKTLGPGFRNLTHLTDLDITGGLGFCQLATLKRDTFANVPSVRHLNLSNCNIIDVTQDAFSALVALETLDLSFNEALGFDLLGEALLGLSQTSLQTLIIDAIVPSRAQGLSITSKQLRFFGNLTHLESLQVRFNRIRGFDDGALCVGMPPKLKYVNVNGNLFELAPYVNDVGCLGSLQQLDMNGFDGYWVPPLRPPDREALGQNLHMQLAKSSVARGNGEPTLAENTKQGVVVQPCVGKYFSFPPNLETFNVEDFGLLYKLEKVKIDPNNRLKRIDASRNHFPSLKGPLCGFENVVELYLSETMTDFADKDFFNSFTSLEILDLSSNNLAEVFQRDKNGELLQGLKCLKRLDLSDNNIGHLHRDTILPLEHLEVLDISINGIGTFSLGLSRTTELRHLDISKNPMHTIPKAARDNLDRMAKTHIVTVNMAFNPIDCLCKNIDFLKWMHDSEVFFGTHENYFCHFADVYEVRMNDIMSTIGELERTCESYVGVFVGASALTLLVVLLLVVALAYRFRWKLRYLYYASRLALQRQRQRERRQEEFLYDAFVSFASEDDDFVNGELRRRLEEEFDLRLCIHTRDFVPGTCVFRRLVSAGQNIALHASPAARNYA